MANESIDARLERIDALCREYRKLLSMPRTSTHDILSIIVGDIILLCRREKIVFASVLDVASASTELPTVVDESSPPFVRPMASVVAEQEKASLIEALTKYQYNMAATARSLGISRVTLYNKVRKHMIKLPDRDQT